MRRTLLPTGAIAALALLAIGVLMTADAAGTLSETRLGSTRTFVPGSRWADLEERKYTVFYEVATGTIAEGSLDDLPVPPLEVTIRRDGDGPALPLDDYSGSFTVYSGGRGATAWRTVKVPEAGRYRIRVAGRSTDPGPAVVLGRPLTRRIFNLILGIAGIVAGLAVAALTTGLAIATGGRSREYS